MVDALPWVQTQSRARYLEPELDECEIQRPGGAGASLDGAREPRKDCLMAPELCGCGSRIFLRSRCF